MLDGDEALAQALRLAPRAVVGEGASVLAAQGLVGVVAFYGITGAAGALLLHHTHGVEQTILCALFCKKKKQKTHTHSKKKALK